MDFISTLIVGIAQMLCECMNMAERRGHKVNLKEAIDDLKTAISDLTALRGDLSVRIQQDNREGRACTKSAGAWLDAVKKEEKQTELILATFSQRKEKKRCFSCSDYKLRKKVLKRLKNVGELRERCNDIETDGGSIQVSSREIPMKTKSVVGISAKMERIWELLVEEDEKGIIGVYGPGGVGKTTLMQSINNEQIRKDHQYDVVIWVTMSREFGVCTIQQAVGGYFGLSWEEKETGEQRAMKIHRALKEKRFLLLLDDVWEEIDLDKTGVPRPDRENKCKVMFTTRSMALCSNMGAEFMLRVEFLEKQHAWELFCDRVRRKDLFESNSIILALEYRSEREQLKMLILARLCVL